MDILFSFLICLIATTAGGISGVGGGVIIKPVLDAFGVLSVSTISFLSGCTVLAMTCYSVIRGRLGGESLIDMRTGTPLGIGAAIGLLHSSSHSCPPEVTCPTWSLVLIPVW